jgi:hypothetical protein
MYLRVLTVAPPQSCRQECHGSTPNCRLLEIFHAPGDTELMSDPPQSSVLGSLPTSRPERRSPKRAARTDATAAAQPAAAAKRKAPAKQQTAAHPKAAANLKAAAKPKPSANPKPAAKQKPALSAKPRAASESAPKPASAPKLRAVSQLRPRSRPEPPPRPGSPRPVRPTPSIDLTEVAGTVVKAAAELAEIGLSAGARALKLAVSRLPRP